MMKRCLSFFVLAALLFLFSACDLDIAAHGHLYGHWHLEAVDTLQGGQTDMSKELVFWNIQNRLIQCGDHNGPNPFVISRFEKQKDSLFFEKLYYFDRLSGDPEVTDVGTLGSIGLHSLAPRFKIESLGSDRMILCDGRFRLSFRKL